MIEKEVDGWKYINVPMIAVSMSEKTKSCLLASFVTQGGIDHAQGLNALGKEKTSVSIYIPMELHTRVCTIDYLFRCLRTL